MKKTFKRTIFAILSVSVLTMYSSIMPSAYSGYEEATIDSYESSEKISTADYIISAASDYLIDRGKLKTLQKNYYVSNPISYQTASSGISDCSYWFIFENDSIIAKANWYVYNGVPYVQIDNYISDEIQKMYKEKKPIAVSTGINIKFVNKFEGGNDLEDTSSSVEEYTVIKKIFQLNLNERILEQKSTDSASLGSFVISGINYVSNATVNNKYVLCWEACLAMKYNYLNNKNYTATDVYIAIGSPNPYSVYPEDEVTYYAQSPFNMNATLTRSALSNSDVISKLKMKNGTKFNPFEIGARDMNNETVSHAMLMYGIHVYNDCTDYYFYDPDMISTNGKPKDSDGTITSYLRIYGNPSETHEKFYYVTSYGNHNYHWENTIY